MMRLLLGLSAIAVALTVACGGDDDGGDRATPPTPDGSPAATRAASTPSRGGVPRPGETQDGGEAVEVTGLAGVVNVAARTIEITRLSGAEVTRIEVTERTVITRGQGGETLTLADIRPSDRIIATGTLGEDGSFVAAEVEVQPEPSPGGGASG